VSVANSGIFGARGSYQFRPQMAAEATFGFSPAGRTQNPSALGLVPVFVGTQQPIPIALRSPVLRDGNVYLYSGTLLTYLNQRGTWRPFFTVGAGGITRTSKIAFLQNLPPILVGVTTTPIFSPTLVPATTRTEMALVLGNRIQFAECYVRTGSRHHVYRHVRARADNDGHILHILIAGVD